MPLQLLKYGLGQRRAPVLPAPRALGSGYDVVIIGGGGHGLATAYYLAKNWGVRKVAVLEKGWLAGGNTARNTTIIRANYLSNAGVRFFGKSVELYRTLSSELDYNIMFSPRGHLTLFHDDGGKRTARWRAEQNRLNGVHSEVIDRQAVARLCPQLNMREDVRYPVLGALYHPGGATARHDAVAWGLARRASEMGVEIHTQTQVIGMDREGGRIARLHTNRGTLRAGRIVQCVAGASPALAQMAGFDLPIRVVPLQAFVSEPVKPVLDPIVVSGNLAVYISQSARGEFVMGGEIDAYPCVSSRSSHDIKEDMMGPMLELFPFLARMKLLRQWGGIADVTQDYSPIMGPSPVQDYFLSAGWGTMGFKAIPAGGYAMAEMVATGRVPDLIAPFSLERFSTLSLVGERAAAAVGH
ncbi:FAD-dependent oxidoreductase [Novosphingobium sp. 1949]|uniref:FAD-dependent oxidoreductase n=1 Tax=Novosphingobium organovorum TaxID=2930092 RepID=A0ABT0BD05_9SPHN|nr:FAD-dependent oxidoreductase [Novosphingobium organovorum]MCJ2182669.1 FAD-dependent oxidoreductase [Novosphingobium organovorum]